MNCKAGNSPTAAERVTGSVKITLNTLQIHTLRLRIVIVVVITGVMIDHRRRENTRRP